MTLELDDRRQRRDGGDEHDAKANGDAKRLRFQGRAQVLLGDDLGEHELPHSLGVGFRFRRCDAVVSNWRSMKLDQWTRNVDWLAAL